MPDMLVKLYGLPDLHAQLKKTERLGILVRRPNPGKKPLYWIGCAGISVRRGVWNVKRPSPPFRHPAL